MFFNFDVYVFEFVQSLMFAFYNAFNLIWVEKYNPINGMTRVALDDFVEIFTRVIVFCRDALLQSIIEDKRSF